MNISKINFIDKTVGEIREEIANLSLTQEERTSLATDLASMLAENQKQLKVLMDNGAGTEVIPVSLMIMKIKAAYDTLKK